jgi:hypothetical protein
MKGVCVAALVVIFLSFLLFTEKYKQKANTIPCMAAMSMCTIYLFLL